MSTVNWNLIYGTGPTLNQGIPMCSDADLNNCVFRDFQLNWSKLQSETGVSALPIWQIFCDTLYIDNDIVVNGALIIFARRVVAPNGTKIGLSRVGSNYSPFSIMVQETVDANGNASSLVIETVQGTSTTVSETFIANGIESGLKWDVLSKKPIPFLPKDVSGSLFYYGQGLQLSLMSIFSLASVVFTIDNAVAIQQLKWVSNLGKFGTDTLSLAAQASTFLSTLQAMSALPKGAILVPVLDETVYSNKANACLSYLQNQQTAYNSLQQDLNNLTQWLANAKTQLQVSGVEQTLYNNLENQSETTYNQTTYARTVAGQEIVADNNGLVGLQLKFNQGVQAWKSSQQTKAALDIVTGAVEILAQLPTIVAAGPEMAALPAVQTAASLLSTASDAMGKMLSSKPSTAASSGSGTSTATGTGSAAAGASTTDAALALKRQMTQTNLINAAKQMGAGAKTIVDSAMKIYDATRTASELESEGQNALNLANSTVTTAFQSLKVIGLNAVTGGSQDWDNLSVDIDSIFTTISPYGIAGASEYHVALQKLIIAGKAYSQTQVAVAKAATELAEAKMRKTSAADKVTIFDQRFAAVQSAITEDQVAGQLLYVKVLDAKRAVYLALESYLRAVEYFTLKPASALPAMPKMTASVNDFTAAVTAIAGNELVLNALNPPPQTMGTAINPGIIIKLDSPDLLNKLSNTSYGSWAIKMANPAFQSFSRIRLSMVRVYLLGITCTENIEIQVVTSGSYSDINPNGFPNEFVGMPMRINFVYNGSPSNPNIVFDGTVPERYANDFFHPTPFTQWTIKAKTQSGQDIDFSGLSGVQIELGGEASPDGI